jgi:hypothetical protein
MKMRLEILLAVACLLLVPLAPARSAETVLRCGTVVNCAVTLQSDLLCESGHGLVLTGGATLDCAGHRITGTGTPASTESTSATALRGGSRTASPSGSRSGSACAAPRAPS